MTIESAQEFVFLRFHKMEAAPTSEEIDLYQRAANEPATAEIWLEVIQKYPDMRAWVAHNKTIPLSILEILSHDEDPSVRHMVAMKRKLGHDLNILKRLAQDPNETVRMRIALNPKTPRIILELLLDDQCSRVVEEAQNRLNEMLKVDGNM
jgi:hypothetical protein